MQSQKQTNNTPSTESRDSHAELINPFTEEVIKKFEYESQKDVEAKLDKAHETFLSWRETSFNERAEILNKFASLLNEQAEEIASIMTKEMGKTHKEGLAEVELCVGIAKYCAENGEKYLSPDEETLEEGRACTHYSPMGVIFSIQPWNFPFYQVIRYSAHAIMAGNTTLLRHASNVWMSAEKLEKLYLEAGLPEGVFQHLYAKHDDIEFLYEEQRVKLVTFTGSPGTGAKVAEKAAKNLKKTILELGGNDAYLVLEDADLDIAAESAVSGRMVNNGETCTAAKRFLVVESIYDEFKKKFAEKMKEVQMGDPSEKTTRLGPMARKDLIEKLDDQVQESLDKGATVVVGGNREKRTGFFFQPTILENLEPGMPAYDDELFGPVASLIKVRDLDHAIEVSNASKFGLGGGIFSKDVDKAHDIAAYKLDTGMVNINGFTNAKPNLPFGGVKQSGYGREHGSFGFHEYVNIKSVRIIEN